MHAYTHAYNTAVLSSTPCIRYTCVVFKRRRYSDNDHTRLDVHEVAIVLFIYVLEFLCVHSLFSSVECEI